MAQQVCLRWNNFHSSLTSTFEFMWDEEALLDITLVCEGQEIKAHKVMLSACSPVFKTMLRNNPCPHPIVILHNVLVPDLEAILQFIYRGEVNISQDQLPSLLKAAGTLQIRGLCSLSDKEKASQNESTPEPRGVDESPESENDASPVAKKTKLSKQDSLPVAAAAKKNKKADSRTAAEKLKRKKNKKDVEKDGECNKNDQAHSTSNVETRSEPDVQVKHEIVDTESNDDARQHEEEPQDTHVMDTENQAPEELSRTIKEKEPTPETLDSAFSQAGVFGEGSSLIELHQDGSTVCRNAGSYPPYPCPFCDRAYTSWGFRRRHIKAVHTRSVSLPCKWCPTTLNSHEEWEQHVMSLHSLSKSDAHNGLLILEEAHMVLQIPNPTRLETFVDMIKKNQNEKE